MVGVNDVSTAVAIQNLNFRIEQTHILKDISLSVRQGEFVGLIGPNGAGKTTLLKCINGIHKSEGSIRLNNRSLNEMTDRETARNVALMHQNTLVSFSFPALEIVLMGRYPHLKRLQGESPEDFRIARKHMKFTDTTKFEKRVVTQISGGERQRVFLAKALTQETDILLLDEPTASLDISHQEQIFKYARELCQDRKTVIAAVHDLKIAARYCTRLILMKEGRILAEGSPEAVLTSGNLSETYGVNALVYKNRITGLLDFYIHERKPESGSLHVHVIGGGGSSSGVIRELFDRDCRITAGVFSPADSDLQCAEVFGIEHSVCEPFSDISDISASENIRMIESADLTILCNMPFGRQNLKNLEAARHAKRLVLIEDDLPESRDFSGGAALELYRELRKTAVVTTFARLHEVI
jgi:iron complex transport system ATP-binding protein